MATRTAAVLRQVMRSVANADKSGVSDRELLRRFTEEGDQAAFTALVGRHTPMVFGVCRRALSNRQDAEDACQATFLVLARKARAGRWQASVANWLYTTARRVAHNAQVAARRRTRREGQAAVPEAVQPMDRMTGRELLAALDEELDRLPPRYREPLVLCYLEGLTRDEAAARLGVPSGTVKIRLERGRKRLGDALTKRGCMLGVGLLALAATSPAGASPPRLVEAVLAAASGSPPAAVAALAKGVAVNGVVHKLVLGLAATVAAAGLGLGVWAGMPAAANPPADVKPAAKVETPAAKPEPEKLGQTQAFSGQVVGPDGLPVPGATLTVVPHTGQDDGFEPVRAPEPTGTDGRFRFTLPTAKILHRASGVPVPALVATAPGYFPGWGDRVEDATIRLAREDAPVSGRVLTLEGQPIAGATVQVMAALAPAAGTLDPWLAALKARRKDGALELEQEYLPFELPADVLPSVTVTAKTDAQGRFELNGYGKDRMLRAVVTGPSIAAREVRFVTRHLDTVQVPRFPPAMMVPGSMTYYGTTCTHAAAPTRPITGVVRDRVTKRPLAGATLQSYTMADNPRVGEQFWVKAETDVAGRFTLAGMPKGEGNSILVVPRDGHPYPIVRVDVPDPPGFLPVTLDVELVRGVWIEGTVTDQETGRPVERATVEYHAHATDNQMVKETLNLGHLEQGGGRTTMFTGRFRVLGLPGKGFLVVEHSGTRYLSAVERAGDGAAAPGSLPTLPYLVPAEGKRAVYLIDIPKDAETFRQPVTLVPGSSFTATLLGPDGQPVAGAQSFGRYGGGWDGEAKPGQHRIEAYNAKKPRTVLFRHVEKNLVGELQVPADFAGDSHTVTLKPGVTATGRVVDGDGNPKAGVEVELSFQRERAGSLGQYTRRKEKQSTDKDGRFRFAGLAPGFTYSPVLDGVHYAGFAVGPDALGLKDVGDIRLAP